MSFRRIAAAILIVLLSIVLPIGLASWSIHSAIWGKPWGRPSRERKLFQGIVKDGEFWFLVGTHGGPPKSSAINWQMRRMDLETGVEREAGPRSTNKLYFPLSMNGEIYGSSYEGIYRLVDEGFVKSAKWPFVFESNGLYSNLFVDNGRLTMVVTTNEGEFRLLHLIDNQWVKGRKIRFPPLGSEWLDDSHSGHRLKIPDISQRARFDGLNDHIWVWSHAQQVHVFVTYRDGFAAYRNGFEFVDDDQDFASALEPANVAATPADHEVIGWEQIQTGQARDRWWFGMACDRDGILVAAGNRSGRVVRRTSSDNWVNLDGLAELPKNWNWNRQVLANPSETASYILDSDSVWNSVIIYRINGNIVQAPHVILPGCYDEYFGHWLRCIAGLFLAWMLHLALLAGGVDWLTQGLPSSTYSFGAVQATLASTPRRALACFVDLLLLMTIVVLLMKMQCDSFGIALNPPSKEEFCRRLFEYDAAVYQGGVRSGFKLFSSPPVMVNNLQSPVETFFLSIGRHRSLLTAPILEFLFLIGLRSYVEGRFGITPGKWLLRIRTMRTSLRPCGFARALVRSVLYWIDIPLLVTPILAAISMMFSRHRQRLGDRVADTVVVKAS